MDSSRHLTPVSALEGELGKFNLLIDIDAYVIKTFLNKNLMKFHSLFFFCGTSVGSLLCDSDSRNQ